MRGPRYLRDWDYAYYLLYYVVFPSSLSRKPPPPVSILDVEVTRRRCYKSTGSPVSPIVLGIPCILGSDLTCFPGTLLDLTMGIPTPDSLFPPFAGHVGKEALLQSETTCPEGLHPVAHR